MVVSVYCVVVVRPGGSIFKKRQDLSSSGSQPVGDSRRPRIGPDDARDCASGEFF